MKNKLLQKTITKLVEVSFKDGKIVESQVTKSIKVLRSLPKYEAIEALGEYLKAIKRIERKHTIYIETAISVPPSLLYKIKKIVSKKFKITKMITSVDPQILGGFKLKIGDEVWDESLLSKIHQVKEAINGRSSSTN